MEYNNATSITFHVGYNGEKKPIAFICYQISIIVYIQGTKQEKKRTHTQFYFGSISFPCAVPFLSMRKTKWNLFKKKRN